MFVSGNSVISVFCYWSLTSLLNCLIQVVTFCFFGTFWLANKIVFELKRKVFNIVEPEQKIIGVDNSGNSTCMACQSLSVTFNWLYSSPNQLIIFNKHILLFGTRKLRVSCILKHKYRYTQKLNKIYTKIHKINIKHEIHNVI